MKSSWIKRLRMDFVYEMSRRSLMFFYSFIYNLSLKHFYDPLSEYLSSYSQ